MAGPTERTAKCTTSTSAAKVNGGEVVAPYVPQTDFGRELMAIRAKIVASGQPLLTWDEVELEIAERRGGGVRHDQ